VTGEAEPPLADDAAWQGQEARPGEYRPRYHEPSFDLPGESPGSSPSSTTPAAPFRADPPPWPTPPWTERAGAVRQPSSPPLASRQPDVPGRPLSAGAAPNVPYPVGAGLPVDGPAVTGGGGGAGTSALASVPPPPREAWRPPRRVEMVPGTTFGVVHLDVPPVTSGLAIGALTVGIASIVVSLLVACFGVAGANGGWGGWAAGAFAVLGSLLGLAGIVLGVLARRQISRAAPTAALRFTGRGLAVAGLSCGAVGLGCTLLGFAAALLLQLG
jgi:hypothetical protein